MDNALIEEGTQLNEGDERYTFLQREGEFWTM
jgi:hypothetical protein